MTPLQILRLSGRCANGFERDGGALYHAVPGYVALCGAKPGRRSAGWSPYPGEAVTCPRCARKARAAAERHRAADPHCTCNDCLDHLASADLEEHAFEASAENPLYCEHCGASETDHRI